MMQYTKFDQRKPFTLIEVKELLDESFELKERKRKSKFKNIVTVSKGKINEE